MRITTVAAVLATLASAPAARAQSRVPPEPPVYPRGLFVEPEPPPRTPPAAEARPVRTTGIALFGTAYGLSALFAGLGVMSARGASTPVAWAFIPLAGPFIGARDYLDATPRVVAGSVVLLVLGVAQTVGAALLIGDLCAAAVSAATPAPRRAAAGASRWSLAPSTAGGGWGLALSVSGL